MSEKIKPTSFTNSYINFKKSMFTLSLFLVVAVNSFGQKEMIVLDSLSKLPIENAFVYSSSKNLLSVSNALGTFHLVENAPILLRCYGYYQKETSDFSSDTIWLSPIFKNFNEISVKPINIPELYQTIIDSSSALAFQSEKTRKVGNYYETVLIIDHVKGDSIIQTKQCDLVVEKSKMKNKFLYQFQATQPKNTYWINAQNNFLDTSKTQRCAQIIPSLTSLFAFDLSNESKFKINFKNMKYKRTYNQLEILDTTQMVYEVYSVLYDNTILKSWSQSRTMKKSKEVMNVAMQFEEVKKVIDFEQDKSGYFIKNCSIYSVIHLSVGTEKYTIKLKKGFVSKDEESTSELSTISSIENYFKAIPPTKETQESMFYLFSH